MANVSRAALLLALAWALHRMLPGQPLAAPLADSLLTATGAQRLGSVLLHAGILAVFGMLLFYFRPAIYRELRHLLLIALLILGFAAGTAIVLETGAPRPLLPIAFPVLVLALLWDARFALSLTFLLAVLLVVAAGVDAGAVFALVLGGAAAAFSVRPVRRRLQIWTFIGAISAAYLVAAVTLGLLEQQSLEAVGWAGAWGLVNAVGSALLALALLPLFEAFTRITTDQTLLELSDLNRPLLRRLAVEAPGTYSHSLSAANLAAAAASAIGANALLARTGVYYHDVGKVINPRYFVENQPPEANPHDRLEPAASAALVRQHVADGLRLAREARLPACIQAFIAEHHGTQPIGFFYDLARERDPQAALDAGQFAYPGPKPQSRETAIGMLADSVQSAARALHDPTPERIRGLVDRIVEAKIAQGQLDDAPLTLREVARVKEQFTAMLAAQYHNRVDYPAFREVEAPPGVVARGSAAARG